MTVNVSENHTKKKDNSPSKGIYLEESVANQLIAGCKRNTIF